MAAQGRVQGVPSLITSLVNDGSRTELRGNIHPLAQARNDVGPVPGSARADRLMLILKRSPEQESALTEYLHNVQDPSSAQFHKFLTPEEFGYRFGISDGDATQIQQWLHAHGFSVAGMNKGRTEIEFSGTVKQLEETFHTAVDRFRIAGVEHWANVASPEIPSALAPVIGGVANLNDFKPLPNIVKGAAGRWDAKLHRFVPALTLTANGTEYLFLGPGDAATIYNTPNSLNTHLASGQATYDGTGVIIGVAGDTLLDSGNNFYRMLFGLNSTGGFTTVYDGNQANFDSSAVPLEGDADMEIAGGLAPGANVIYYAGADTAFQSGLFLGIYRAIDDNQISILNVSYGACEAALGASGNLQVLNAWEQAAAQGITVTVSSGDSGSAGCDNPNLETAASQGFGVNGLASTPYDIAVGGTDFDVLPQSFTTYVGTNSSNYTSAVSYIPEEPWNDSTKSNGSLSNNVAAKSSSGNTSIWAGSGGQSSAGNGGSAYAKPSWQTGFSPSNTDSVRDLPDASLFAGAGNYDATWALCVDTDCADGANSTIHGVGGTSTSAPALAGILALVSQKMGSRLGQANWVLYKLAQTTPSIFHSVTTGNNSVYCTPGTPDCGSNSFMNGYNAQAKYSMTAGLGSVDATLLVNHWGDDARTSTTTTLSLNETTFAHGTPVTATAGVSPASATGAVAITNNYASQPQATTSTPTTMLALSGGSASGSYSEFPGGTYNVYASYSGDGNDSGSISKPVQVIVSPENSVLNLTVRYVNSSSQLISLEGKTVPLGTLIVMDAQPVGASQAGSKNPVTNATGTVLFQDESTASSNPWNAQAPLDSTGNSEVTDAELLGSTHSIAASYNGDLSYNASTAKAVNFTIAPTSTTIALNASVPSTIGEPVGFTAQISAANVPGNAVFFPSGTVTFTDTTHGAVLGMATYLDGGDCKGVTTYCFEGYLQVNSTQLRAGSSSIIASYSGDSNFSASGNSAPVSVTCTASCWNATSETLGLAFYPSTPSGPLTPGQSSTTPVAVSETGGFTGAVNLTCTVAGKNSNDQYIPTCSFSPTTVTITSNQAVQSTLTLTTTAPTQSAMARPDKFRTPWCAGMVAMGSLLLFWFPARRFRCRYLVGLTALVLCLGWVTACGGGGTGSAGGGGGGGGGGGETGGTTPDTYTVTFRAADAATGTVTAQGYFTFTVMSSTGQ